MSITIYGKLTIQLFCYYGIMCRLTDNDLISYVLSWQLSCLDESFTACDTEREKPCSKFKLVLRK